MVGRPRPAEDIKRGQRLGKPDRAAPCDGTVGGREDREPTRGQGASAAES